MEEETKTEETAEETKKGIKEEKKEEKPLDKMTAKELREIALEIPGIDGVHAMKKEELLAAIKEAKGIKDEEPVKKAKKKVAKKQVSVKELKDKIIQLKKEKKDALEAKDNKMIDVYRRRINRLKKQTRKAVQA